MNDNGNVDGNGKARIFDLMSDEDLKYINFVCSELEKLFDDYERYESIKKAVREAISTQDDCLSPTYLNMLKYKEKPYSNKIDFRIFHYYFNKEFPSRLIGFLEELVNIFQEVRGRKQ